MTTTVFHGGQVFDGTGAAVATGDVLVEDGRIRAVGTDLDGDDGVDCTGMALIPGLFDCHIHMAMTEHDLEVLPALSQPLSTRVPS